MKKIIKFGLCGILSIFTVAMLGSCNSTPEESIEKYTVSFDTQGGSSVASQEVASGSFATRPTDPTKDNYSFIGWFKEAGGETIFDFENDAILTDTTIYASWLDSSSSDATTAKFYWNYTGAPSDIYETVVFKNGGRISKPADPTRDGYEFADRKSVV